MPANVFEQYQKYYESLITRHKSNCLLENQNQNQEAAKQTQPQVQQQQPQAQPVAQPISQQMPQNPALPQQLQNMTPVYAQQQPNWTQSDTDTYSRSSPVQHQYNHPQKLVCSQQPQLYYGPDGSGFYYCSDVAYSPHQQQQQQQQQSQTQFPIQPLYAYYCVPENYNYYQFGAAYPTVPVAPNTCVHPLQTLQTAQPTFKPDGPAEAAAEAAAAAATPIAPVAAAAPVLADPTPKKPVFCYPYGVNGFQGGFPCSPCSSCKVAPQPNAAKTPAPSAAAAAAGTTAAPQPCEGNKDCKSGWAPAASGEAATPKADKEVQDRLPLGADEPFVVGPTTYQYFFG